MSAPGHWLLAGLLALCAACGDTTSANPSTEPGSSTETPGEAGRLPDLILVVVDTLRADHLSTYGYPRPTSPRLDELGARGVVFTDVTAQSSWTLPSMASLFSGKRLFVNAQRLPSGVPSLAERLRAAGYETAAFLGNPAVNATGDYDRGFDHFIGREQTGGRTWNAPDLERALARWLSEHPPSDAPRFVYLHYFDPHWPYKPVEDTPLIGEPFVREDTLAAWDARIAADSETAAGAAAARAGMLADIDAYDREIAVMDRSLARCLLRLERERERLVLFASDHGEVLWDHAEHDALVKPPRSLRERFFRDHSYHMFRELLFTPLIAQGLQFDGGARIDTPVENIDILPTLLRAAGLPDDPALDGRALQDLLGPSPTAPELLSAHSNEGTSLRRPADGLKLVFPTDTGFSYGMPIQLYDTRVDPHERRNIADEVKATGASHPAARDLNELLAAQRRAIDNFDLYDGESPANNDAGQQDTLRELGYLDGDTDESPPAPGESDADAGR